MRSSFDAQPVLARLRDFQRRTVEHVFRRLYLDDSPSPRFLVADEVGLGKTMVAKGIIAKTLEHLWSKVDRIDIVYVCSNQVIARQNIDRLSIGHIDATSHGTVALPTRMTLLPLQLQGERSLDRNKVNFISFTPGTTFDLKDNAGVVQERVLLYELLKDTVANSHGLLNVLQAYVGRDRWKSLVRNGLEASIDPQIERRFKAQLHGEAAAVNALNEQCQAFDRYRKPWPPEMARARNELIGRLRALLARACLDSLEPDLIILDEFQRFKDLLHGEHDAAMLARQLLEYRNPSGEQVRTLLLSATPYRMLTLSHEGEDDDHYRDFVETVKFLAGSNGQQVTDELQAELRRFREAVLSFPRSKASALEAKEKIEETLRAVMARTERVGVTASRDSMIAERVEVTPLHSDDLQEAKTLDRIARLSNAPDVVDYWKSAPYVLNFMRDYVLKQSLGRFKSSAPPELLQLLSSTRSHRLRRRAIRSYLPLPMRNGRMRKLFSDTVETGLWRLLWIPASNPYWAASGHFADASCVTKSLIFSSWNIVPDAIAGLCSYEAERRIVDHSGAKLAYDDYSKRPQLLRFGREEGRLAGMPTLALGYPSIALARRIHPLLWAATAGRTLTAAEVRVKARDEIRTMLSDAGILSAVPDTSAAPDQKWYWAALAILDQHAATGAIDWLDAPDGWLSTHPDEDSFAEHVAEFRKVLHRELELGPVPSDLAEVLAELALGGPGVLALRSLGRVLGLANYRDHALRSAAAIVASGFRSLFNQADVTLLLRAESDGVPYWKQTLEYAVSGNLQSVLDEYVHVLVDSLGVQDLSPQLSATKIAERIKDTVALRPSLMEVDEITVSGESIELKPFRLRGRFAMRLADTRNEDGEVARQSSVQAAFNSPFRPFVLATTSVGQEGLDFHLYCHRVYHWNLPSNPVDMEQREGRVHRYKGHAIRLNLAETFGLKDLSLSDSDIGDPWQQFFALAKRNAPTGSSDLIPYWIWDGPIKVERCVPMLPYSKEVSHLQRLKRSLSVYRLAFGQPRQDDLLAFFENRIADGLAVEGLEQWQISLTPE